MKPGFRGFYNQRSPFAPKTNERSLVPGACGCPEKVGGLAQVLQKKTPAVKTGRSARRPEYPRWPSHTAVVDRTRKLQPPAIPKNGLSAFHRPPPAPDVPRNRVQAIKTHKGWWPTLRPRGVAHVACRSDRGRLGELLKSLVHALFAQPNRNLTKRGSPMRERTQMTFS